jgi:small GTP-binding protein
MNKNILKFEIKTINNIDDIAKHYGIKKKLLNKKIPSSVKIYDGRYLKYRDTIKLLNNLKLDHVLHAQLNVLEDIQSEFENVKSSFVSIGIMGHINHGKTTLVEKITSIKIVEDSNITQNIEIYQHKDLFLIDTPGHELFHMLREHILSIIDMMILVISLEDGIAKETKRIIDLIINHNIQHIILIVFTKSDIAKHKVADMLDSLNTYGLYDCKYMIIDYKKDAYEQIRKHVNMFSFDSFAKEKFNYLVTIKSTHKIFNLLKINFGKLSKKDSLLFDENIYRVNDLYDLNLKPITKIQGPCFVYCTTDCNMNISNMNFVQTNDVKKIEYYNKYLLGNKYTASFIKNTNQGVYIKKKIVVIIEDVILYNIICNLAKICGIDQVIIVVFRSDKSIIQTLDKTQHVILFRLSNDKEIKYILHSNEVSIIEYTTIYQLEKYFAQNNLDIFNNVTINNLAQVVKIFNIKNKKIIGCKMLKGSFKMNQKVNISPNAVLSDKNVATVIVSIKQDDKFIKQTKQQILFGVVFQNLDFHIEENYYLYN